MARIAKFWVAFVAAAGVILSSNLLPDQYVTVANTIIAAVGAALVYLVPNAGQPVDTDGLPAGDGDPGDVGPAA